MSLERTSLAESSAGTVPDKLQDALHVAKSAASDTLDKASDAAHDTKRDAAPALRDMASRAQDLADQGMDGLGDMTTWAKDYLAESSEMIKSYAKDEPMKAMLIAAATGAALMAIVAMMTRSRD